MYIKLFIIYQSSQKRFERIKGGARMQTFHPHVTLGLMPPLCRRMQESECPCPGRSSCHILKCHVPTVNAWLFHTFLPPFFFRITCSYYAGTDQAGEWRTFHPSLVLLPWMKPARSQKADSIYHGPMHPKTPTWQPNSEQNIKKNLANALLFTHAPVPLNPWSTQSTLREIEFDKLSAAVADPPNQRAVALPKPSTSVPSSHLLRMSIKHA